jgi:hypothetical protein
VVCGKNLKKPDARERTQLIIVTRLSELALR